MLAGSRMTGERGLMTTNIYIVGFVVVIIAALLFVDIR